ncbi:MAG: hypothetical protein M0P73_04460 [Syntrophobacterales bacterium]|nr:hypothetical protein [Syntrophobacterales bacterium]
MKRWQIIGTSVLGVMVWCWAVSGPAWGQGRGQGFRPCPYTPYECAAKGVCRPLTITGKVSRVFTETLQDNMYPGMAIIVDTKDRGQVRVHLGPVWYLERQAFSLEPGQEVRVQGVCLEEKGQTRLIAAEVTVGDSVLKLRDMEGKPMWEAWRQR